MTVLTVLAILQAITFLIIIALCLSEDRAKWINALLNLDKGLCPPFHKELLFVLISMWIIPSMTIIIPIMALGNLLNKI